MQTETDHYKEQAARRAVESVRSGMVLGLGFGTTAHFAVQAVAERIRSGEINGIQAVLCSERMRPEAEALGIPLTTLEDHPIIDLTIDGADEVDPRLNLIKGGGGALLHEKVVAQASRREIIIIDESKFSQALGTHHSLPVEVIAFGWRTQAVYLEDQGARVTLRRNTDGTPFSSDQLNLILDCDFGPMADPRGLAERLSQRAGIVEHGLFLDMTCEVISAGKDGIRRLP